MRDEILKNQKDFGKVFYLFANNNFIEYVFADKNRVIY